MPPGSTVDVPVHVRAPERPGRYRLSIDLVHEHVRWFGCALEWPVDVRPAHRVAVIGRGERLERALDDVHFQPEVEPVLLEIGAAITPERFGHQRVPGLGEYLLLLRGNEDVANRHRHPGDRRVVEAEVLDLVDYFRRAVLADVKAGDRVVIHPMKHADHVMAAEIQLATPKQSK